MKNKFENLIEDVTVVFGSKEHIDAQTGIKMGKDARKAVPRSSHAQWAAFDGRPDPVETFIKQGKSRVQELLPIRYERMSASPFSFYRGNAIGMAADLAKTPTTGIEVQACGDAHIGNFGFFASPEGELIFDLNDFDETFRAPWEWDVKRLAASIQICAEHRGFKPAQCTDAVLASVQGYQAAMESLSHMGTAEVWSAHISLDKLKKLSKNFHGFGEKQTKVINKTIKKARSKNNARAVAKLTEVVDGQRRIISDPPLIVPLKDIVRSKTGLLVDDASPEATSAIAKLILTGYMKNLRPDARMLISQYRGVDMARKVVGVGSVGTRCWIVVLQGANEDDYLVLQVKEAQNSVLEGFVGKHPKIPGGKRVVEGQRAIQLVSDPLLGYKSDVDIDGVKRDFYIRQLWNSKGSADLEKIPVEDFKDLAHVCGWTLARAHARTGDRFQIAGYLGKSPTFGKAIVKFAQSYARQNQADYETFKDAISSGRLDV